MVGEIALAPLAGAVQAAGSVALEAPVAAVSALPVVIEAPIVAAQAVETAASVIPEALETPLAAAQAASTTLSSAGSVVGGLAPVAQAASEASTAVKEGITALSEVGDVAMDVAKAPAVDVGPVVSELHVFLKQGNPSGALEFLAYGKIEQLGTLAEVGSPEALSIDTALLDLQRMLPEYAQNVLESVQGLNIPEHVRNDPQFLEQFMLALQEGDKQPKNGKSAGEKAEGMRSHIEASAKKAMQKFSGNELTDADLERLKKESAKKAAMLQIRQYMNVWRESVAHDRKLDELAQSLALRRIDLLEARLLTQEAIKWDGLSVAKLIALAYVWMKEMQEESLPQPKL